MKRARFCADTKTGAEELGAASTWFEWSVCGEWIYTLTAEQLVQLWRIYTKQPWDVYAEMLPVVSMKARRFLFSCGVSPDDLPRYNPRVLE